jgi:hypothetical protein
VAKGKQEEAKTLLEAAPDKQALLRKVAKFTDYSGRTFECTAYEYAYWAKDRHMLRMLESYMKEDEETKAFLFQRVEQIEETGLTYQQHGKTVTGSKHFDLSILINALKYYVNNYDRWVEANNLHEIEAAWMAVGRAQREVPAHVAHEYCRPERSFDPLPSFNEETLPRVLTIYNDVTNVKSWFPLAVSASGLGSDFALMRACCAHAVGVWVDRVRGGACLLDLVAVRHLDKVRTEDLKQSREFLNSAASEHGMSM